MAEFVGHAVHLRVLDAVGRHPEGTDVVVVGAAVGRAVKGVHHHDHHLILISLAAGLREGQRVAEEGIEVLHTIDQVVEVETHGLTV